MICFQRKTFYITIFSIEWKSFHKLFLQVLQEKVFQSFFKVKKKKMKKLFWTKLLIKKWIILTNLMTSISIECKSVKTLVITDRMDQQMTESIAHNKPKAGMRSGSGFFLLTIVSSIVLRYVVLLIKITFRQSVEAK